MKHYKCEVDKDHRFEVAVEKTSQIHEAPTNDKLD